MTASFLRTFRCLLISPSDVDDARAAVTRAIAEWNSHVGPALGCQVQVVYWRVSARPELGDSVQGVLNVALVDDADLGVALFWTRVGTPTQTQASGSLEEIERLRAAGRPVMVYFCTAPAPDSGRETQQLADVTRVRAEYEKRGPVATYANVDQLERHLHAHLSSLLADQAHGEQARLAELGPALAELSRHVETYLLVARNLKLAFELSGEAALDEDASADRVVTEAIVAYNHVYDELRTAREVRIQAVARLWGTEAATEAARELLSQIEGTHRRGPFRFNQTFRDALALRAIRRRLHAPDENHAQLEVELRLARSAALDSLRRGLSDCEDAVRALELRDQEFTATYLRTRSRTV